MLTCQIISHNNADTIGGTLDSLKTIDDIEIIIIDNGSSDDTVDVCKKQGLTVYKSNENDLSKVRNNIVKISKFDWQFFIHPWENLTVSCDLQSCLIDNNHYILPVVKNNVIVYESRIWNKKSKYKFKNPVFEFLDVKDIDAVELDVMLYSVKEPLIDVRAIKDWKYSNPTAKEPLYYESLYYLQTKQWDMFLNASVKYLFDVKSISKPVVMMKYYTGIILCHIKKDVNSAIKHVLECLAVKPLMAEFWCLLGDIYYYLISDYKKSKRFYQNAIFFGSKRTNKDKYPIELSKYNDYPLKMIENCDLIKSNTKFVKTSNSPSNFF